MKYWLERFSFSFVILGCVLIFEANKAYRLEGMTAKVIAMTAVAIVLLFLAARGLASRHGRKNDQ